jgi:type II secretory pathway pseudopilin PulG
MRRKRRIQRPNAARRGAVLLEVLVALAILGVVGSAVAALAIGTGDAMRRAREADAELRRANAFFSAVALWTRDDLDRRLGTRRQGSWWLHVDRPAPSLYTLELSDTSSGRVLLRSALFRPPVSGSAEQHAER